MRSKVRLHLAVSVLGIAATGWANPVAAQDAAKQQAVEEITVTGTSIRGTAPVGSSVTTVTLQDIKATGSTSVTGVMSSVPQLMGMGQVDSGTTGQGAQQALIHQLGQSASTSTLTLIDGHRAPTSGTNHSFVDPNMIPINMLERVEVLADGVSAVYGSDAIAGVVNFITRKRFDGIEVTGNAGFADGKQDVNLGFLAGAAWDSGSALFAYSYTRQGALANTARPWTYPDHTGVTPLAKNRASLNCEPASLSPSGQSLIFLNASATSGLTNTQNNFLCSDWKYADLVPKTQRNNAMMKFEQNFGDKWKLDADLLYATRDVLGRRSRGTLTATAFGAGAQANPFYTNPVGYAGAATTQTIRWDSNALLGPGAYSFSNDQTVYGDVNIEYKMFGDWTVDLLALAGRDDSAVGFNGALNASAATLALNGTTNSGGSQTQVVPNTNIIYTQFPLTQATALDVWNPASSTRTSAAVIAGLRDDAQNSHIVSGMSQARLQAQGTLFELPAGPVKLAIGGETYRVSLYEYLAQGQGAGPTSNSAVYRQWHFSRDVQSAYLEANVPLIGREQGIPLMQELTMDVSARLDHYSDFGNTTNPKVAFDWRVYDDLKLRADWSTSFVAPPEDEIGGDGTWNNTNYTSTTQNASLPIALFPQATLLGVPCTATSCNIASLNGIQAVNSNPNQGPSHGLGWTVGFDYTPSWLHGFVWNFTLWNARFKGGSQGAPFATVTTSASLSHLMTLYPSCATPAQIKAITGNLPLVGAVPVCTSYIYVQQNDGLLNLDAQGIDTNFDYVLPTDNYGTFSIGDAISKFTHYVQSNGPDGVPFSVLNKSGAHGSIAFQMRGHLGWNFENYGAQLFMNYTGGYQNWNSPDNPVILNAALNPSGGGDRVSPNTTFDLNLTYDFQDGYLGDDQLSLSMRNMFDKRPPYDSSNAGYNAVIASPLGRLITIGFTSKL
ncbi:MAG TPA: TonB-dependent receptor [Rhizomicrobium sp.]|nr:TonB-dependent receptor [Rhizomicrobium sp.]